MASRINDTFAAEADIAAVTNRIKMFIAVLRHDFLSPILVRDAFGRRLDTVEIALQHLRLIRTIDQLGKDPAQCLKIRPIEAVKQRVVDLRLASRELVETHEPCSGYRQANATPILCIELLLDEVERDQSIDLGGYEGAT